MDGAFHGPTVSIVVGEGDNCETFEHVSRDLLIRYSPVMRAMLTGVSMSHDYESVRLTPHCMSEALECNAISAPKYFPH